MNKDLSPEDQELVSLAARAEFNEMKDFEKRYAFNSMERYDAQQVLAGLKEKYSANESLEGLRKIGKQKLLDQFKSSDQTHREGPG